MTAGKTAAPSTYVSGFCGVRAHERCLGQYGAVACTCECGHQPAEPEPELEPEPPGPRILSLFSGYGGLDLAVQAVLGGEVVSHAEIEPAACRILEHRFPGVPNLGDVAAVDWTAVGPVDVVCGGFPCTDVSAAGKRAGIRPGTRSGLWAEMARAVQALRPPLVVIENVRGLCSADAHHPAHGDLEPCPWCLGDDEPVLLRALGAVLGDLADIGFDAEWVGLRAADVGAPHGRFRVFVLAWPAADAERGGRDGRPGELRAGWRAESADGGCTAADAGGRELQRRGVAGVLGGASAAEPREGDQRQRAGRAAGHRGATAAHAEGDGRDEGWPEPAWLVGGSDAAVGGDDAPADAGVTDARGARNATSGRQEGSQHHTGTTPDRRAAADATHRDVAVLPPGDDGDRPLDGAESGAGDRAGAGHPAEGVRELGRGPGVAWGPYAPAIHRWERCLGRPAPSPTEPGGSGMARIREFADREHIDGYTAREMLRSGRWGGRLHAPFVEWLMGLPAGWVTAVPGLTRNEQLKALGNGVVWQQAAEALRILLPDVRAAA